MSTSNDGHVLGRRDFLHVSGALGLAALGAPSALARAAGDALSASCVLTPPNAQGPYYAPLGLERRRLSEGRPGRQTLLVLRVVRASDCAPIPGAYVDVWHTDSQGLYSAYASLGTGGQTFLRGYQVTDAHGLVRFDTIYPGWYPGRTPHLHLNVFRHGSPGFTTQLYFPEPVTDAVFRQAPYAAHGPRPLANVDDPWFEPGCVVRTSFVGGTVGARLAPSALPVVLGLTLALA